MITDEQEAAYNEWRKTAAYPHDPLCTFVAGVEYQKKIEHIKRLQATLDPNRIRISDDGSVGIGSEV